MGRYGTACASSWSTFWVPFPVILIGTLGMLRGSGLVGLSGRAGRSRLSSRGVRTAVRSHMPSRCSELGGLSPGRARRLVEGPVLLLRLIERRPVAVVLVREPDSGLHGPRLATATHDDRGVGALGRLWPHVLRLGPLAMDLGELPL
jgi:hypothetical protein